MPTDKKITELPIATSVGASDVSVLVNGSTDYQYNFTLLLQFLQANLTTGASIAFGATLPQNTSGKNGDVFVNTSAGSFAQKISGAWSIVYTLPAASAADGTLLYGAGLPGSGTGKNLDSYINTLTGIFYKKSAGTWSQVFSMATGPQGPQGAAGTNGVNGTNGNTILFGSVNPSNTLTGIDGNFYINTSNFSLFGPKTAGVWGDGVPLIGVGMQSGGNAGQILVKVDDTDFNTEWQNNSFANLTGNATDNTSLATALATKQSSLGFTPENTANKNAANGYAGLDGSGKVSAAQLPSYVDDILEFPNFAALPATGETGKIYVTLDTNSEYRWSGSAYIQIMASPGNTDAMPEGSTNLYFTAARVLATLLTGIGFSNATAITATDTILGALGKLQAQITAMLPKLVKTGGTAGQIYAKVDSTDYNAGWIDAPGGSYTLPVATASTLGGVKQGSGVSIAGDGTISALGDGADPVWNRKGVAIPPTLPNDEDLTAEATVIFEGSPQMLTNAMGSVFKMWFTQGYANVNIVYAESLDGLSWVRSNTVCVANHARSCVLKVGATYYMYASLGTAGTQIDRYTSTDGITWTLGTPAVITRDSSWNSNSIANSSVYYDSGDATWKMLVEGNGVAGIFSLGYYHSADGITWTPYVSNPVINIGSRSWGGPDIQKVGSTFWIWCHATPGASENLPSDLYRFSSPDMTTWAISNSGSPTLKRLMANEGVDSIYGQVADPTLVEANGKTYLYYTAVIDGHVQSLGQIKVAVADMTMAALVATKEGDMSILEPAVVDAYPKMQSDSRYVKLSPGAVHQVGNIGVNGSLRLTPGAAYNSYPQLYADGNQIGFSGPSGEANYMIGHTGSTGMELLVNGALVIHNGSATGPSTLANFGNDGSLAISGNIGLMGVALENGSPLDVVGMPLSGNGGLIRMKGFRRSIFTNSDVSIISNSSTETSIIPTGAGSSTSTVTHLPATVGRQYIVRFGGVYSTPVTPGMLTIKIKYCGVTLATKAISTLEASALALRFCSEVVITTLTIGDFDQTINGSVNIDGDFCFSPGDGFSKKVYQLDNNGATINVLNGAYPNPIDVTAQWDTADTEKILKITQFSIESLN